MSTKYSEQNGITVLHHFLVNKAFVTTVTNGINAYHNMDEERPSF